MTLHTVTYDDRKFKIVPIKSNGAWIDNLIKKNGEPSVEMTIQDMHGLVNELLDAAPEYQEPENPLDMPLPCDIKVGHGTIRKGCKLSTLVIRMNTLYDLAVKYNSAMAPDPRMNEPWTDEERSDLRNAVVDIFNWKPNQEPTKAGEG